MATSWWVRFCKTCGGIDGAFEDSVSEDFRRECITQHCQPIQIWDAPRLSCICESNPFAKLTAIKHWFKAFDDTAIWEVFHGEVMWKYQNLVNLILANTPVVEEYVEETDDWDEEEDDDAP